MIDRNGKIERNNDPLDYWQEYARGRGISEERIAELSERNERMDDLTRAMMGRENYYSEQERLEKERYWEDYERMTGISPRYPIMAGAQWNRPTEGMPQLIGSGMGVASKLYGGMV